MMNLTTVQLWDSAKRLREYPALLDVAGSFVMLYAKALHTSPARAKSFLLSIRPMNDFTDYIGCLNLIISEMPTLKRYPYEPHDVFIAIVLHGRAQCLTVPYIEALDDVYEWMAPNFGWALKATSATDFTAIVTKYWGILKIRKIPAKDAATVLGISRMTFYNWLDGSSTPPAAKMNAYLNAFRTYVTNITGEDPDK